MMRTRRAVSRTSGPTALTGKASAGAECLHAELTSSQGGTTKVN